MEDEWIEISVPRERRTWIIGKMTAKCKSKSISSSSEHLFQNVFEIQKVLESQIELKYSLAQAKSKQSVIKGAYTKAKLDCALKLPRHVETFASADDAQYRLELRDLRFTKPPKISNVVIEEGYSYALYEGDVVGYVLDTVYETQTVLKAQEYTPIVQTAEPEIKVPKPPPKTPGTRIGSTEGFSSGCLGSIQSIVGILFLAFILVSVISALGANSLWLALGIFVLYILLNYGQAIVNAFTIIFRILGVILFLGFLAALGADISRDTDWSIKPKDDPGEYEKKEIVDQEDAILENARTFDTLIVQNRIWKDYDGNEYTTELKINKSDLATAAIRRTNMHTASSISDFNKIYYDLLSEAPEGSFKYIYSNLDTIRVNRGLTRNHFAEVIVSMVQDIPYTLILPEECDWHMYQDRFVKDYLQSGKECVSSIKNGLFSPEEFAANLKGDCDSRTLLLFKILHHYKYDVRIVNSEKFSHSILAINLDNFNGTSFFFDQKRYTTWETTSPNIRPGRYFDNLKNQNYWQTALY